MKSWFFIAALLVTAFSASPQTTPKKSAQPKSSQNAPNEWNLRGRLAGSRHDRNSHKALCSILEKRHDYRALVEERKAWLEDNSWDSSELISFETESQFHLYDPQYAIEVTKRFLSRMDSSDQMYGWANNFLGRQLMGRDKFEEAIPFLETATKANPTFSDYWEALGNALVRIGKADAGIDTLRKAVGLYPSSARLHAQLGDALGRKGDLIGQETEYNAACSLDKKDPTFSKEKTNPVLSKQLTDLARVQIERGKFSEADETLTRAIQADPQTLYAYLLRARIFERKGQPTEAQAQRQRAKILLSEETRKEKNHSGEFSQPLILFAMDDPLEVVRIFNSSNTPLTPTDHRILAGAYFDLGRVNDAVSEFEKSLTGDSQFDTAQSHFIFAEALKKAGLVQKAEEHYRKAYEMDPENTTYRYEYEALKRANISSR